MMKRILLTAVVCAVAGYLGARLWLSSSRTPHGAGSPDLEATLRALDQAEAALDAIEGRLGQKSPQVQIHPTPDLPAGASHESALIALFREYDRLQVGSARTRIVDHLCKFHRLYLLFERPGDVRFAKRFMKIADESPSSDERQSAVIALHRMTSPMVVDWYIDALHNHRDPSVRLYAVEGLAWVQTGSAAGQAQAEVRRALSEHADARVRTMAVTCLVTLQREPSLRPLFAQRLRDETDPRVQAALREALRALLPE